MTTKQPQLTNTANPPSLDRHARKCKICHHKDREDIELDFLHWHNCVDIAADYELEGPRVLYRHAHATGLFNRRALNLRFAAAHIVQNAESIEPSASAILKAIEACSQINDRGEWVHVPRRVIYEIEHRHAPSAPDKSSALPVVPDSEAGSPETEIPNRHWLRLENAATPTKQ
jgi:hypothetical protein